MSTKSRPLCPAGWGQFNVKLTSFLFSIWLNSVWETRLKSRQPRCSAASACFCSIISLSQYHTAGKSVCFAFNCQINNQKEHSFVGWEKQDEGCAQDQFAKSLISPAPPPTAYLFSLSVGTSLIESYSIFWQTIFHLAMSAIFEFLHDLLKYQKMFKLIYLLINFGNSRICITMERATRLQSPVICVAAVRGLSVGANYSGCCRTTTQFHTNTRSRLKIEMWNKTETCARWVSGGWELGGWGVVGGSWFQSVN